jgi:hypothetical protein
MNKLKSDTYENTYFRYISPISLSIAVCQRPGDLYTDFGDNGIYFLDWTDTSTSAIQWVFKLMAAS